MPKEPIESWKLFDGGGVGDPPDPNNQDGNKPPEGGGGKPGEGGFTFKSQEEFDEAVNKRVAKYIEDNEDKLLGGGYYVDPSQFYSVNPGQNPGAGNPNPNPNPNPSNPQGQGNDISSLTSQVFNMQTRMEEDRINREISEATKDFPLANRKEILFNLISKPNANIRKLVEESHKVEEGKKQSIINDYVDEKKKNKGAPPTPPPGGGEPGNPGGEPGKPVGDIDDFDEAERIAMTMEREASQE